MWLPEQSREVAAAPERVPRQGKVALRKHPLAYARGSVTVVPAAPVVYSARYGSPSAAFAA